MALIQGLETDTGQQFKPELGGARDALVPPLDACVGSQCLCYCDCRAQSILHTLPNAPTSNDPFVNLNPSNFQPRGIVNPRNATPTASANTGVITVCVLSSIWHKIHLSLGLFLAHCA